MPGDSFRPVAPWYDRIFRFHGPAQLEGFLDVRDGQLILDIAGGTGRVSGTLTCRCTRVVLDASFGMLKEARAKGLAACNGAGERLPFPTATFDRALMVDSLHHLEDPERAIAEALRVLRLGGRLVIEEPNIRSGWVKLIALAERLLGLRSRFINGDDMARLVLRAGGAVTALEGEGTGVLRLVAVHTP